ncbi:MAG: hypothetical protein HOW97_30970 [Catenulispora sp.]|nr:hypothetical protein [Catenulispora sp.]
MSRKPLRSTQSDFLFVIAGGVADEEGEAESVAEVEDVAVADAGVADPVDELDGVALWVADGVVAPVAAPELDELLAVAVFDPDEQAARDSATTAATPMTRADMLDCLNMRSPVLS